ncbi:hypothetical protein HFV01_09395 [Limnospira fusiformis SAG 85.79]|uniref:Uncharacterized protein n=1 Tax=Limnospira maxima CS-328 TaxID=513049 RepID=B5VVJ8_LIMMA|nr:hypothetical protein AmaxDRAFT_0538 [Limnospira maxima CS-328]EKD07177.1 hypothetical protein SPLC1_S490080 [Arthrospira platensis C1]QJB25973.1 hypothetical protein HFV01_09395 [Limnospira fusiformis SAG 85.79]UWU47948.1 hypothetical protein APLC1_2733 [Arthrospira platensis C1]
MIITSSPKLTFADFLGVGCVNEMSTPLTITMLMKCQHRSCSQLAGGGLRTQPTLRRRNII